MAYQYTGRYTEATTGLVHLDARWYNPQTQRFVQPDLWNFRNTGLPIAVRHELMWFPGLDTAQLLRGPGQQMGYGYVGGNPLVRLDMRGLNTSGIYVSLGAGLGLGGSVSGSVVWDDDGNIAIQVTVGGGAQSPNISATGGAQTSNADTVDDLGGLGTEFGNPIGEGLIAEGGSFQGDGYVGTYGGGASFGSPVGATGQVTKTWTPVKVNIKDVIDKILGRDGDEEPPEPPTEPSPGIDYGADLSGHRNIPC